MTITRLPAPATRAPNDQGDSVKLASMHHNTMITGHARRTVDFDVDFLGMRLIKKNPVAQRMASCEVSRYRAEAR